MSPQRNSVRRVRSAATTRAAILEAARARFARESYETVGMRDIAADVGVDPALVNRYFGSKEELFGEVLNSCAGGHAIWQGDSRSFGQRAAAILLDDPLDSSKLDAVLIMLRSAGSPRAEAMIRQSISGRFSAPATAYLGGGDRARVCAALIGSVLMGTAIQRAIKGKSWLKENDDKAAYRRLLAQVLQTLVDGVCNATETVGAGTDETAS